MTAGEREKERGLADERLVKAYLSKTCRTVTNSTEYEDKALDIDAYVNGKATSIKCMGFKTPKNFAFELEVQDEYGTWRKSWYHNGQAEKYVMWHRGMDTIFGMDKKRIQEHVALHDFDRITGLTNRVKEMQSFHRDKDVKCGLISIQKLVDAGIAAIFTNIFKG